MAPDAEPLARSSRPPARQWLALIAPPATWSAQELVSLYVSVAVCRDGHPETARALMSGVTMACLLLALGATALGYGRLKELTGVRRVADNEGRPYDEMLALSSVLLGVVFALAIVWGGLPTLLLAHGCETRQ